jgi:CheY-like chemotaxis protein
MLTAIANLLIVEDDVALRTSLSAILATFGHRVRSAADGFSALAELRQEVPDIIVSDLNMPGMSGFEFLSVVRRRFPAIQVIAMSSAFVAGGVPNRGGRGRFLSKGQQPGVSVAHRGSDDEPGGAVVSHQRRQAGVCLGRAGWEEGYQSGIRYAHLPGVLEDVPPNLRADALPSARNMLHILRHALSLRDGPTCCCGASQATNPYAAPSLHTA